MLLAFLFIVMEQQWHHPWNFKFDAMLSHIWPMVDHVIIDLFLALQLLMRLMLCMCEFPQVAWKWWNAKLSMFLGAWKDCVNVVLEWELVIWFLLGTLLSWGFVENCKLWAYDMFGFFVGNSCGFVLLFDTF